MTLKFWKWFRKERPVARDDDYYYDPELPTVPVISISVTPDGRIGQFAEFPDYPDEHIGDTAAKNFAMMLFLLSSGRLLPTLQRAVAMGGEEGGTSAWFSQKVLSYLNQYSADSTAQQAVGGSLLVVRPRDAFGFTQTRSGVVR